jgi:hypothetical protein
MTLKNQIEKETIEVAQKLGETRDVEALYVLLGKQQKAIAEVPDLANDPNLDPPYDSTHMGLIDDLRALGSRIAALWARKLHEVICGTSADTAERHKLLSALNVSQAAAIAAVTTLLLPVLSPAVAAPVAAIIVKQFLAPAGDAICDYWGEKLDELPA